MNTKKEKNIDIEILAFQGDLVQIQIVVFDAQNRMPGLPKSTSILPYKGWIKGFLINDEASIGQIVNIRSFIGRTLRGRLVNINPIYDHNFGEPQSELMNIGDSSWSALVRKA